MEVNRKITTLILSDVCPESANSIAEHFISSTKPTIDLIICCGPFTESTDWSKSKESTAIAHSDIAATIATLEQIQCRVIYLPSGLDPHSTYNSQLHLTPNSVNIHCRRIKITENLFIAGFAETTDNLVKIDDFENRDDDVDLSGVQVQTSVNSIQSMEDVIVNSQLNDEQGVFVLMYKHTHLLNHFLFHSTELLEKSKIGICVIPQNSSDSLKLPKSFGKLSIVSAHGSLRTQGKYTIVDLVQQNGTWLAADIQSCYL